MCVLAGENIVIWRGLLHSFKNVSHFKNLRTTATYGNCADEQIKIRLNLGHVRHSIHNFPHLPFKDINAENVQNRDWPVVFRWMQNLVSHMKGKTT